MLRSISFHMDLRSKYLGHTLYGSPFDGVQHRDYVEIEDFSFLNFIGYALYTPLMVSGPIMSFTEWLNQIKCALSLSDEGEQSPYRRKELSARYIAVYVARFFFCYFVLSIWLHFVWTNAFIKYGFPFDVEAFDSTEEYTTYLVTLCRC